MKKVFLNVVVLSQLLMSNLLAAGSGENISTTLQTKLNDMHTMKAHFNQVVKAKNRVVSTSSGMMALSRPGRFRWETQKPMKQVVIADGKHLWIYDVALEQVTVTSQSKFVGGPAGLFLSGYNDNVAREFKTTMRTEKDKTIFDLKSNSPKANFQRVKLIFKNKDLCGIFLYDQLGQATDVKLSDIKTNASLQPSFFKFKSPRGVDVIRQ